eukprot:Selendium_serpulae@DN6262_c0_g1_i3.p2
MAHSVQAQLEDMVPELQDLLEKHILTEDEVKIVVAKRREFEYSLITGHGTPRVFLDYVAYEAKLEELRQKRATKLGWKEKSWSDKSIKTRIHFIFTRALQKFPYDTDLWLRWMAFCRKNELWPKLEKVIMKAIAQQPHNVKFWGLAVAYQLEMNNLQNARSAMLRAIRACPQAEELWIQMLNMEWKAVEKVASQIEDVTFRHSMERLEESWKKDVVLVHSLLMLTEIHCSNHAKHLKNVDNLSASIRDELKQRLPDQPLLHVWLWRADILAVLGDDNSGQALVGCLRRALSQIEETATSRNAVSLEDQRHQSRAKRKRVDPIMSILCLLLTRFAVVLFSRNHYLAAEKIKGVAQYQVDVQGKTNDENVDDKRSPKKRKSEKTRNQHCDAASGEELCNILDAKTWVDPIKDMGIDVFKTITHCERFAQSCFLAKDGSEESDTSLSSIRNALVSSKEEVAHFASDLSGFLNRWRRSLPHVAVAAINATIKVCNFEFSDD